ncbi:ubiquitin carboxyl-terminal hydrolase 40 isoform X2 [Ascaphus truei]|uniref:ubiquitin carboxyl-terminal hydrolase 40 isoform X2 n=1 Tax=Ascaphus truei TaxID=8439 RepID=UPI003F5A6057
MFQIPRCGSSPCSYSGSSLSSCCWISRLPPPLTSPAASAGTVTSALESSLEGTSGHDLIQRLYHGTVVNRIECRECGYISERQEGFLDLTVTVKGMCGLEEALCSMYVEEELFEGDNLYRCGACDRLVPAAKSAKLGKLPPFLTVSLLRFNFDFTKCERYKETSRYTFPARLDLRPFCEQHYMEDDSVYTYELFSVIIHKGGCYGGHYHVYIRDVDQLGQWLCQEEVKETGAAAGDAGSEQDHAAVALASVIAEAGADHRVPVDQLGQKLLEHTGSSWNKTYRKQHGAIHKFLQSRPSVFQLSSDGSLVGLAETVPGTGGSDAQRAPLAPPEKPRAPERGASHWFDFNDSTVQSIREKDMEKHFQGKESAYMLFYRKSQLQRPQEANGNARYGVSENLLREMDEANQELQRKRNESDTEAHRVALHLHLSSRYRFDNGALHPSAARSDSVLDITADRRQTVGELRRTVFQLLDRSVEGRVLSIARALPAGLHLFQELHDAKLCLGSAGLADGGDLFVWNGKEVGGLAVQSGAHCAPLLLTILRPALHSDSSPEPPYTESQSVFPCSSRLSDVRQALACPTPQESLLCSPSAEGSGGWSVCPPGEMGKTLRELGLKDGSSLLLLDRPAEGALGSGRGSVQASDQSFLQVQDLYRSEGERQTVRIPAAPGTMVSDLRNKAIEMLGLQMERGGDTCLRPVHKSGKLLPPVLETISAQEAELKAGGILGLCKGKAPTPSQIFLYFVTGTDPQDGHEQEIILEGTVTVRECLERMLQGAGLSGETGWHLRKMDWCYEAGEALDDEDASLNEMNICSGDTFVITEGILQPKGFLKLATWIYCPKMQQDAVKHVTSHLAVLRASASGEALEQEGAESDLHFAGDMEISEDASLHDLKTQILTLPVFGALGVPSPDFLRVWTLENKRLGKILRSPHLLISDYKLGRRAALGVEPLQVEECLGPQDLLLRVQLSVPGERRYLPPADVAWDVSHGCTATALRQRIAAHCSLPADKVEIAKHMLDKHEWLPISSWTQQVSKKRRKKKQESLQGAPYHLKDGDIIGVKNILLDDRSDFSTEVDHIAKENRRQLAADKKKKSLVNDPVFCDEKGRTRGRKAETSLSIRVGVFR